MNNLLRTLTESRFKSSFPDSDLKLLLTTVKEGRRQYDAKLSDPFYDSLEGLLIDLKTITIDNRDAEAFLKPVSKAEVPDYYDVISNAMDFQTMLKKVKQKQYKSKREFMDDLELIWSNCYTYNATENHPLRQCVKRLKVKADRLLKYITDRKERTDPSIPPELGNSRPRTKINGGGNGLINGYSRFHTRTPSAPNGLSKSSTPHAKPSIPLVVQAARGRDVPFSDTPALLRTQEGMSRFLELDRDTTAVASSSSSSRRALSAPAALNLMEALHQMNPSVAVEDDSPSEDMSMVVDGVVGDKRKLNGISECRPRKRTRLTSQYPIPLPSEQDELTELWWGAAQSDALLPNGLPAIPFASSSQLRPFSTPRAPRKSTKRATGHKKAATPEPKTLLGIMNGNIKTMKRVRHTHARFAALNVNTTSADDPEGGGGIDSGFGAGGVSGPLASAAADDDLVGIDDDRVDERPWRIETTRKGKGRARGEVGEENAEDCVRWMGGKVLEHAGFQGTSKVALDVLAGVTSEYLLNVGRTIRFLADKYSNTMTAEEIILHTLFESGASRIQDLERYIRDDVERYGARLGDLEKKLVSAYRESTAAEVLDDEGLFDEEDEEDAGALAIGDFADALGEDYLGLRELGIAAEFGMSSLSIPKKLLKGKKGRTSFRLQRAAKPTEPPPPFPPPPPLPTGPPGTAIRPWPSSLCYPTGSAPEPKIPPTLSLSDDAPSLVQIKMGPLGQIIKGGPSGGSKKKAKAAAAAAAAGMPGAVDGATPKKKKGGTGVGTGNGRKKKLADAMALQGQGLAQQQDPGQQPQQQMLPPVVAASA
ncbi:hypothetical protein BD779DRAFT_1568335 [Infundibulicybe gibba]|nr:hypothetical protein BD779DRAFT_1568335 [Infundibulicybe gibba]